MSLEKSKDKVKKDGNWIKDAVADIKHPGICTGSKLGSASCPVGSRQYALAMTLKKAAKTAAKNRKSK